jgi:hypothetical protein
VIESLVLDPAPHLLDNLVGDANDVERIRDANGVLEMSGNAAVDFNISGAPPGFTVRVTVSVGAASCQTSFTPS